MDIRHLNYLLEVAKYRSFTKAAETLHVTQPTISKMIKAVEDELGVLLFDRSTKHIELTDAGRAILVQAQQIVHSFDHLASELADVMEMRKGTIRIGIPPMTGAPFFPAVIAEFHRLYPGIRIRLIEEGGRTIEREVENGSLDIGVAVLPVNEAQFEVLPFAVDDLKLILHPNHRLAGRESVLLEELRDEPFIMYREDFALHEMITTACIRAGFRPNIAYSSSQWDFISEMVAVGLGVALLPQTICRKLDPGRIAAAKLEAPAISWNLAMIWSKDRYLSFAGREWLRFARAQFSLPQPPQET